MFSIRKPEKKLDSCRGKKNIRRKGLQEVGSSKWHVILTSRYLYVVLSAGTTPFLPPASTTMLHSVILSSIYEIQSNNSSNLLTPIDNQSSKVEWSMSKARLRKLTVKLSTVVPTNSIDLYVAPETDISPIIYNWRSISGQTLHHKKWKIPGSA